jgi:hypothetical protein
LEEAVVFELLEADLGRARAGKEEQLQLVEIEVAVSLEAHEDGEIPLRERSGQSGELLEAECSVGQGVVFME